MKNLKIRTAILTSEVRHYQVAAELGMQQTNFSRLLTTDISQTMENKILAAIERVAKRKENHSL